MLQDVREEPCQGQMRCAAKNSGEEVRLHLGFKDYISRDESGVVAIGEERTSQLRRFTAMQQHSTALVPCKSQRMGRLQYLRENQCFPLLSRFFCIQWSALWWSDLQRGIVLEDLPIVSRKCRSLRGFCYGGCAGWVYVNLVRSRVTLEEGMLIGKMPS